MRIGLNATCFDDRPSGANQRFRLLYGAVIRRNPQHDFIVYEPAEHRIADWFADSPNVTARRTRLQSAGRLARIVAGLRYWPQAWAEDALDLFESISLPLFAAPCSTLLTIHDLRSLQAATSLERAVAKIVLRHAFRHVDHVIAVSDVVRHEILAFRPDVRVSVVHNGVQAQQFTGDIPPDTDRFALALGHIEARKNLTVLIAAIARLRDQGMWCPLVIAGRDGGMLGAIRAQIAALDLAELVRIVEDADDATVRALYAACTLVVVPSGYEGFGIALIEAMAAGRPLVTSDIAVFREVTEGQGRYFAVDDPGDAAAAIKHLWTDAVERARLVAYGDVRVRDFDFDRLADQVAALYVFNARANRARAAA